LKQYWKIAGIGIGVLSVVLNLFLAALLLQRVDREEDTLPPIDPAFAAMLEEAGLKREGIRYLRELGIDYNQATKVFQTTTKEGDLALVQAVKDTSGVWKILYSQNTAEDGPSIGINWFGSKQTRKYNRWDTEVTEREYHFAYCGNDAVKAIALNPEQLPENATVNIQQEGSFYLIHVVVYSTGGMPQFLVQEALEENGCVKPRP